MLREWGPIASWNEDFQDISFKFTQHGAKLEGKACTPISEGVISGDLITFIAKAP